MNNRWWLVILLGCLGSATGSEVENGFCTCGVFDEAETEPLIVQEFPFNISCHEEGVDKCRQLCVALAETAKETVGSMICEILKKHVENLKPRLYTKACNNTGEWIFSGLESSTGICCHEGEETPCAVTFNPN